MYRFKKLKCFNKIEPMMSELLYRMNQGFYEHP
jgi:hypothetical protein